MTPNPDLHIQPPRKVRFAGNLSDVVPRELLFDRDLTSKEIVLWQHMAIMARQDESMPYHDLMQRLNVSRPTLANLLLVLRLTRWLSLDEEQVGRHVNGVFAAAAYVLHDSRCPVEQLNPPEYLHLLAAQLDHRSPRVRALAERLLEQHRALAQLNQRQLDAQCKPPSAVQQKLAKNHLLQRPARLDSNAVKIFNLATEASKTHRVKKFNSAKTTELHRVKNFNSVSDNEQNQSINHQVKKFNLAIYNNNNNNKYYYKALYTTFDYLLEAPIAFEPSPASQTIPSKPTSKTADQRQAAPAKTAAPDNAPALAWEGPLSDLNSTERDHIVQRLGQLTPDQVQAVLDESHAIILAKQASKQLHTTAYRFVLAIANRAASGQFAATQRGQNMAKARKARAEPQAASPLSSSSDLPSAAKTVWQRQGFSSEREYEQFMCDFQQQRFHAGGISDPRAFKPLWLKNTAAWAEAAAK